MAASDQTRSGLTFREGGWVVLLAAAFSLVILLIVLVPAMLREDPPGDGVNPETYGFALTPSLIADDAIVCAQKFRDAIPSLLDPPVLEADEVELANEAMRGKFLVSTDRVVGVVVGGEARAYPLPMLTFHEVINDRLGGVPIVIAYNGPCDSVVVFLREVAGETLTFGISGLVYNSAHLLYDRRGDGSPESLWSPLLLSAVTGPALSRGSVLRLVPAELTHWDDWRSRHPDTTVARPDPIEDAKHYRELSYERYYKSEALMFPVDPVPPEGGPGAKTRCLVVEAGGVQRVYFVPDILERVNADGVWTTEQAGETLRFYVERQPVVVRVETEAGVSPPVVYALWFAWHAMHPDASF